MFLDQPVVGGDVRKRPLRLARKQPGRWPSQVKAAVRSTRLACAPAGSKELLSEAKIGPAFTLLA